MLVLSRLLLNREYVVINALKGLASNTTCNSSFSVSFVRFHGNALNRSLPLLWVTMELRSASAA
jgi:hypothetical protein